MRFVKPIRLQTPESVELEFQLAGIGNRLLALLLDYTAWALLLSTFVLLWSFIAEQTIELLADWLGDTDRLELWLLSILLLVTFLIYVGYFVVFETLWQGQTPGKRFAKIRVICDDGRPVGLAQSALRALLRPVDDWIFIGFLLVLLTPLEKRLGDWLAGTLVVQTPQPNIQKNLVLSAPAIAMARDLQQEADFSQMLPDDFAVVREYLQRRKTLDTRSKGQLSTKLAQEMQRILDVQALPPGMSADAFLEAVYHTYQQSEQERSL